MPSDSSPKRSEVPTVQQIESFRVVWLDTDASGRIHFTAVFRWVEATEMALHRRLGLLDERWQDMPRKKVEATYHRPLGFDDELEVRLRVRAVGRTSVTYDWDASHRGKPAISGSHVAVHVGDDGRPAALAERVRRALEGE